MTTCDDVQDDESLSYQYKEFLNLHEVSESECYLFTEQLNDWS